MPDRLTRLPGLALLPFLALAAGCGREPRPGPPPPTREPTPEASPSPSPSPTPTVASGSGHRAPTSLVDLKGVAPGIAARLEALEADYLAGEHTFAIASAEQLLDSLPEGETELRLRLYYLLARSYARERNPGQASHYERLFRELFEKLQGAPPRDGSAQARLHGAMDRSVQLLHEVHPAWASDPDGSPWVNVRLMRRLERAGPLAVISEEHPGGGGLIHACLSPKPLQEFAADHDLGEDTHPLQRDPRFGFFFLEERR